MLLGAAKLLSAHRDAFRGKIKFLFEPSEESIPASMKETVRAAGYDGEGGAGFMIQQGVLDGVDMALALHVQPVVPAGKIQIARHEATASSDVYDIMLTGKGGHGAMPENAVDPVPAMAELITAIHMLPTGRSAPWKTASSPSGRWSSPAPCGTWCRSAPTLSAVSARSTTMSGPCCASAPGAGRGHCQGQPLHGGVYPDPRL